MNEPEMHLAKPYLAELLSHFLAVNQKPILFPIFQTQQTEMTLFYCFAISKQLKRHELRWNERNRNAKRVETKL